MIAAFISGRCPQCEWFNWSFCLSFCFGRIHFWWSSVLLFRSTFNFNWYWSCGGEWRYFILVRKICLFDVSSFIIFDKIVLLQYLNGIVFTAGQSISGALFVGGSVTLTSSLAVTGATTLVGLSAGVTTLTSTLAVSGAATLSSTLSVSGATTLQALSAGTTTLTSTLTVAGSSTYSGQGLFTSGIASTSTSTGSLIVTGGFISSHQLVYYASILHQYSILFYIIAQLYFYIIFR